MRLFEAPGRDPPSASVPPLHRPFTDFMASWTRTIEFFTKPIGF
jgi:hypothetical protein